MTNKRAALALVALLAIASSVPAVAQVRAQPAVDRTTERLMRLENAVRDLQAELYSVEPGRAQRDTGPITLGAPQPQQGPEAAATTVRLGQLERQMQELTGRVEELTYRLSQQQRQIDTLMEVMGRADETDPLGPPAFGQGEEDFPFDEDAQAELPPIAADEDAGPTDLRGGGAGLAEAGAEPAAPAVELPADPEAAYDVAYDALLAGDYDEAEAAFEAYLEAFPDSEQTPDARYLLGEIYLATGAYAEAATAFLEHVRAYPDDSRSPEAYLKLGTAFARLGKTEEACKVFGAGAAKFPDASASVKARLSAERDRASCAA